MIEYYIHKSNKPTKYQWLLMAVQEDTVGILGRYMAYKRARERYRAYVNHLNISDISSLEMYKPVSRMWRFYFDD